MENKEGKKSFCRLAGSAFSSVIKIGFWWMLGSRPNLDMVMIVESISLSPATDWDMNNDEKTLLPSTVEALIVLISSCKVEMEKLSGRSTRGLELHLTGGCPTAW